MVTRSDRLDHVHSDIRGPLYQEALRMESEGINVLKLNTGNPGRFGFKLPNSVRQALALHIDEAVPYCDVRGMAAARNVICTYHIGRGLQGIMPNDVFICNGVSEAASMLLNALIGTGDEILLPSPCYSLWSNNAYLCGGKPVFYRCDPANEWNPDIEDIESKITDRTKAILVINPNNPTGAVYSKEVLLAIAEIARQHHLVILADEIYDRLVMDGLRHESIGALAPDLPCVTFNGLSKSHIICGFRCGWMVFNSPDGVLEDIKQAVTQLASMRLCGNALTQLVIPAAMADPESTRAWCPAAACMSSARPPPKRWLRSKACPLSPTARPSTCSRPSTAACITSRTITISPCSSCMKSMCWLFPAQALTGRTISACAS